MLELHWTSDGDTIISCSPDKSIRAWNAATGTQIKKMAEHDNFVNSCCPLRRGPPLVVSGSDDGTVKVTALRAWPVVPVTSIKLRLVYLSLLPCHTRRSFGTFE